MKPSIILMFFSCCLMVACDDNVYDTPDLDAGVDSSQIEDQGTDKTDTDLLPDTDNDMSVSGTKSTANILCDLSASGNQQFVYKSGRPGTALSDIDETLEYNFAWACGNGERTLTGNGVPNHGVAGGEFASKLSAQTVSFTFTTTPADTGKITEVKEPGFALNGVKFDPGTAGTCPDAATVDTDCNYAMGSDSWRMVATPGNVSPWKFGFGVDENDAHVQPTGAYHYHGNPVGLVSQLNNNAASSMTLVGWATDGFPIYSVYGHSDVTDLSSSVVEMKSSYKTVDSPGAGRPDVADFPLGHFIQDWQYADGSGDLDECNGRFAVTPEFPNGIYHYYITNTYPFVQRCVKGESAGGGGPGPRP